MDTHHATLKLLQIKGFAYNQKKISALSTTFGWSHPHQTILIINTSALAPLGLPSQGKLMVFL
jgi:hypothetical protein